MEASRLWGLRTFFVLLVVSSVITTAPGAEPSIQTGQYTFLSDQSTIVQTGGFAGVRWSYAIEGQFCLIVEAEAGIARFEQVDANAVDLSEPRRALDPNEVLNLTGLTGTVADEATLEFTGQAADGSSVLLTLTVENGTAHLTGQTTPPSHSADFFVFSIDATAARKYAGGTGDPNTPYLIATAEQMNAIGTNPEDWDQHFQLTADIDLAPFDGKEGSPKFNIIASDVELNNELSQATSFTGVFNGNHFAISNLQYSRPNVLSPTYFTSYGLFGCVAGPNAAIRNVTLVDPNVDVPGGVHVGALVGWLVEGAVDHCRVAGGMVSGNTFVGGLLGQTGSHDQGIYDDLAIVTDSHSSADVIGVEVVGGLAGGNLGGSISRSSANANVSGDFIVGGLLGCNKSGVVTECYSTGQVTGAQAVGGLFGSTGTCNCFCVSSSVTMDCYSTAAVEADVFVGGLVGSHTWGWLQRCYAVGRVGGQDAVGGLIGTSDVRRMGTVDASFWDAQMSGQSGSAAGVGLATAEMQTARTFLEAGWDFVDETENGTTDIWWIDEGQDYPRLWWERDEAFLEIK